jgi:chromosome segregation ATPase
VCDSIAAAESRADELDRRLRESSADSASELSSANEQLRQQVASLRAELERAESSRKAATDKESQLSERVDQLQAHIDNQAKELEDVTASLEQSQRTIVRLENQGRHTPSQMMHGIEDSQTRQHSDQDHCADGSGNDKPLGEASAMEHDANGDAGKQAYKRQRHISEKDTEEHRKRVKAEGRIRELEEKLRGRQLELDEQRRIAFNMLRESKQLEDGLSDVGLIQKSDAYKQLTQQLSDTAHDRDSLRKDRNSLQQSLDEANARQSELKRRAELAEDRAKSLAEWQDRMNEVNKRINSLIEERDAAQTALENERITRSETCAPLLKHFLKIDFNWL